MLEQLSSVFGWEAMGFQLVGKFMSAADALGHLEVNKTDVLLTDIRLGSESGIELAQKAREMDPGISIILLSAFSEFSYARSAIQISVFDYLLKPVTYGEISACFEKLNRKLGMLGEDAPLKPANYQIELVKRYIGKHLADDVRLEVAAEHAAMNPAYFSLFFKKHTGESFIGYLSGRRIEMAKELLKDPQNKV
jgi:two-component system response regulator YesN